MSSPSPGVAEWIRQVRELAGARREFTEHALLEAVREPLERILESSEDDRAAFVFEAVRALPQSDTIQAQIALRAMVSAVLRRLPLNTVQAVRLVEEVTQRRVHFPYKAILTAVEGAAAIPALHQALLRLREVIDKWSGSGKRELHRRIDVLVYGAKSETSLDAASGWTKRVFEEISQSAKEPQWRALFLHAKSLANSTAPRKWQNTAVELVEAIGRDDFLEAARRWLRIGPMPDSTLMQTPEREADYQKGFIWTLGALGAVSLCPEIADFAFACFRKIPQLGAVSHRVGNACVNALAAMPGLDAVSQISRLAMRVKYDVARRLIEKGLVEAARRNGVTREDLEAMSVPTFGLDKDGARVEEAGDCQARLEIVNGEAALTWSKGGKALKSVPAGVKADHAELVAGLKKANKELGTMLATQRLRLERLLLSPNSCRFDRWKAWYFDHPVVSVFARRLIWEIQTGDVTHTGIWLQDRLVDWAGEQVPASSEAAVRLWHPIRSDVQTILSWRCWLEDHGVTQPFKQAHREVYLLTEAERQTNTYSNRFASHIVRQHQFAALCRERGWQFNLMGEWDSHNTPYLTLPQFDLRAEFDVDFPEVPETSGHAVYLAISTGRIQFYATGKEPGRFSPFGREPLRLEEVPAAVFSEVMRDADLFVGVASIGMDPLWRTQHAGHPHDAYWGEFAFGELSESAQNRRGIIESLLPKLAIRDRCRLEGRYLCVRGQRNEYWIHLGSGNVLMEPGRRYLCIVHGPGDSAAGLALPFEGDRSLSLILSKAFLLANDTAIKDETIRRQLESNAT